MKRWFRFWVRVSRRKNSTARAGQPVLAEVLGGHLPPRLDDVVGAQLPLQGRHHPRGELGIVPGRRRGLDEPDEQFELRIRAPRPAYTGTMAEAAGTRIAETIPEPEVERVGSAGEAQTREGGW